MALSDKLISILIFAGVMTSWVLVFQQMFEDFITSSGHSLGVGEIYLGFMIPTVVSTVATWWLIKRVRANRA